MARYVESGVLDIGLTGLDWILEYGAQVEIISDLFLSLSYNAVTNEPNPNNNEHHTNESDD